MPFLGPLWMIFGVSFVIECFSLLWTPARDASLPNLVPRRQLANANSLGLITTYATPPLGASSSRSCRAGPACCLTSRTTRLPRAVARRVHVRALGAARQPDPDPTAGADVVLEARPLARRQGHRRRCPVPARELARVVDDARHRRGVQRGRGGARARPLRDRRARRRRSRLGDPRDLVRYRHGHRDGVVEQDRGVRPASTCSSGRSSRRREPCSCWRRCPRSGRRRSSRWCSGASAAPPG